ncbi:MAG: IS200/IS605 family transposase [Bacteroidia bacterium]|nr:MAG: IS200/IS605 family transposase [Bacteroidia bacterium]
MGQVYYKLFYHVIWRTKLSQPIITPQIEQVLVPFIENKAKRFGCYVHTIQCVRDHIHAAMNIPPSVSISDVVGKIKGSSSYFLNQELRITASFSWQDGFGVVSFGESDLPRVKDYILNQKHHHRLGTINSELEECDVRHTAP